MSGFSIAESINPLVSVFNVATTKKTIETTPVNAIANALRLLISRLPYLKAKVIIVCLVIQKRRCKFL